MDISYHNTLLIKREYILSILIYAKTCQYFPIYDIKNNFITQINRRRSITSSVFVLKSFIENTMLLFIYYKYRTDGMFNHS